jgi:hypothetical protein
VVHGGTCRRVIPARDFQNLFLRHACANKGSESVAHVDKLQRHAWSYDVVPSFMCPLIADNEAVRSSNKL